MTTAVLVMLTCLLAGAYGLPSNAESETVQDSVRQSVTDNCTPDPLVSAINHFSFDLARQIGGHENFFMSPLSIFAALGMTYMGTGGDTAKQMQDTLKLVMHRLQGRAMHERFRRLMAGYASINGYQLNLANGMFVQQTYPLKQTYVQNAGRYYRADVRNVDFALNGAEAVRDINSWVADGTNNTIKKLIEDQLNPLTRMVILNAIYFNAAWENPFNEEYTMNLTFHKNDYTEKSVPMMSKMREEVLYYKDEETKYQFIKLPYKGDDAAMLLALPEDRRTPADLKMTPELLCRIKSNLQMRELEDLMIPRFRIEHSEELRSPLMELGMRDLFTESTANLTGITDSESLSVSSVVHKAFIKVDEKGTEASGATGIVIVAMMVRNNPSFVANHPFLFYIVDETNGLVLFSGRVADP